MYTQRRICWLRDKSTAPSGSLLQHFSMNALYLVIALPVKKWQGQPRIAYFWYSSAFFMAMCLLYVIWEYPIQLRQRTTGKRRYVIIITETNDREVLQCSIILARSNSARTFCVISRRIYAKFRRSGE